MNIQLEGMPVKLKFVALLFIGQLAWDRASADAPNGPSGFPTPEGMAPCAPGSPVFSATARVVTQIGGEFLGCFQSERKAMARSTGKSALMPVEYAFSIALRGGVYSLADLDKMLSTVKGQWKGFDPLSKEFKGAYKTRLNELIKSNGLPSSPTLVSVKPLLVSIDDSDRNYYLVTSIRTYTVDMRGERGTLTKVNSDAVVLRGSQLIRLTIQRTLSDPTDVDQVQGEISNWARATAQSSPEM